MAELNEHSVNGDGACLSVYQGRAVVAYAARLAPAGFVILAPDTRVHPLLGYSDQSPLRLDDVPENGLLAWLRAEVPARLAYLDALAAASARDGETTAPSTAEQAWAALLSGEPLRGHWSYYPGTPATTVEVNLP